MLPNLEFLLFVPTKRDINRIIIINIIIYYNIIVYIIMDIQPGELLGFIVFDTNPNDGWTQDEIDDWLAQNNLDGEIANDLGDTIAYRFYDGVPGAIRDDITSINNKIIIFRYFRLPESSKSRSGRGIENQIPEDLEDVIHDFLTDPRRENEATLWNIIKMLDPVHLGVVLDELTSLMPEYLEEYEGFRDLYNQMHSKINNMRHRIQALITKEAKKNTPYFGTDITDISHDINPQGQGTGSKENDPIPQSFVNAIANFVDSFNHESLAKLIRKFNKLHPSDKNRAIEYWNKISNKARNELNRLQEAFEIDIDDYETSQSFLRLATLALQSNYTHEKNILIPRLAGKDISHEVNLPEGEGFHFNEANYIRSLARGTKGGMMRDDEDDDEDDPLSDPIKAAEHYKRLAKQEEEEEERQKRELKKEQQNMFDKYAMLNLGLDMPELEALYYHSPEMVEKRLKELESWSPDFLKELERWSPDFDPNIELFGPQPTAPPRPELTSSPSEPEEDLEEDLEGGNLLLGGAIKNKLLKALADMPRVRGTLAQQLATNYLGDKKGIGSTVTDFIGEIGSQIADKALPGSGQVLKFAIGGLGNAIQGAIDSANYAKAQKEFQKAGTYYNGLVDKSTVLSPIDKTRAKSVVLQMFSDVNADVDALKVRLDSLLAGKGDPLINNSKTMAQLEAESKQFGDKIKAGDPEALKQQALATQKIVERELANRAKKQGNGLSEADYIRSLIPRSEGDMDADGLRDFAKSIIDKVLPLRTNIPPKSRKVLETYGSIPVKSGWVCRAKLNQILQTVIKATTRVKYDDLYHLSINFLLEDGTYVLMEKNEVINIQVINANFQRNKECRAVENVKGLTLAGIVDKTRKQMGDQRFAQYNAITNNCQVFIKSIISANGMKFDDSDDFILQKVVGLVSKTPGTIAQKLTNFANRINRLVEGEGIKRAGALSPEQNSLMNSLIHADLLEVPQLVQRIIDEFNNNSSNNNIDDWENKYRQVKSAINNPDKIFYVKSIKRFIDHRRKFLQQFARKAAPKASGSGLTKRSWEERDSSPERPKSTPPATPPQTPIKDSTPKKSPLEVFKTSDRGDVYVNTSKNVTKLFISEKEYKEGLEHFKRIKNVYPSNVFGVISSSETNPNKYPELYIEMRDLSKNYKQLSQIPKAKTKEYLNDLFDILLKFYENNPQYFETDFHAKNILVDTINKGNKYKIILLEGGKTDPSLSGLDPFNKAAKNIKTLGLLGTREWAKTRPELQNIKWNNI
jgi:hypothetical protein